MKNVIVIFLFTLLSINLSAQELVADVTVNYESLPIVNKEILREFGDNVESYLNNNSFTGSFWEFDKIPVTIQIFFTGAANEYSYNAQIVIQSLRRIYDSNNMSSMLIVNDSGWEFRYEKNQAMIYDPNNFESVTSILDYYAYMIIGFEQESWEKFAGTEMFQKAFQLVNLAQSSDYTKGWKRTTGTYSRMGLVEDILNEKYSPFREAFSDYYYGIDMYEKNKEKAQAMIANLVNVLDKMKSKIDIRSVFVKTFFKAHADEIVERMKDYPDKSIFETLKKIDPPHTSKYDAALD